MEINALINTLKQSPYYTKQNLSLALSKDGADLDYWIKKLLKEKILISLKKGFYISSYYRDLVNQNPEESSGYLEYLANILRWPSYVSLEYVLAKFEIIPETAFVLTSVTPKSPRVFSSEVTVFNYRNIKKELFFGYQVNNFRDKKVKVASKAKALFDYLYLKRTSVINNMKDYLLQDARINWSILSREDKDEFKSAVKISSSSKMEMIANILKKEGIL